MTYVWHVKVGRHTLIADQVGHTRSSKHLPKVSKNSINKKQKRAPLYFAASSGELWGDDNTCDRISANNSCDDKWDKSCDIDDTPRPQSDTTWPMPSFECTSQHLEIHNIGSGTFVVVPIVNHKNIWLRKKSPSLVGSRFEKHGGASALRSWLRHLLAPILSQLSTISSTTPPGGSGSTPKFTCLLSNKIHSYIILHLFQSSSFEDGGQIEF